MPVFVLAHFSTSKDYRLRLDDGTCVFVLWHDALGPLVYKDKAWMRPIEDWWENKMILDKINWLTIKRGSN